MPRRPHGAPARVLPRGGAALVALVLATGCVSSDTARDAVTDTLPSGTVVTCPRPPQAYFETERAAALSAAFPDLMQTILSSASVPEKVASILPDAPSPELVDILAYRVCLERGKGVVPEPTYQSWVAEVRPALLRRVGGTPGDSGGPETPGAD